MNQVLVTVSKGIIQEVVFFDSAQMAIEALSKYVKTMNVEHDDAALYDSHGLIAYECYSLRPMRIEGWSLARYV